MNDALSMGSHGLYVWGSYLLTAVVLGWNLLSAGTARRKVLKGIREMLDEDQDT